MIKEELLPFVERSNAEARIFKDSDFEWLRIIACLKKTDTSIKDIKIFINLYLKGDSSIDQRLMLIDKRRKVVIQQIQDLQATLETLNYKH